MRKLPNKISRDILKKKKDHSRMVVVNMDIHEKGSILQQVSSDELKRRRIDVYPYLM